MPIDVHAWHLPYVEKLQTRSTQAIELVVIHCTELPDLQTARSYGERILYADTGTGASGHYYIDRDGRIHEFVPLERVANHTRGYNPQSVGIELVNLGRYPDWYHSEKQEMREAYTEAQLSALDQLLEHFRQVAPGLQQIAGHEDLDLALVASSDDPSRKVARKRDPGPMFPWWRYSGMGLQRLIAKPQNDQR
jgi:N-acetylmuramoyl-L-alanine amidase